MHAVACDLERAQIYRTCSLIPAYPQRHIELPWHAVVKFLLLQIRMLHGRAAEQVPHVRKAVAGERTQDLAAQSVTGRHLAPDTRERQLVVNEAQLSSTSAARDGSAQTLPGGAAMRMKL